jgi:NAD(P)H dehydrogenase (quinone)
MSIVVTAATGQLGRLVVASLLDRGVDPAQIVATGRSTERLSTFAQQGVRVAQLDYGKPADGVISAGDTVLLISGSEVGQRIEQHRNVIELAQKAGAARIVYTSVLRADRTTLAIAPEHVATEQTLKASGVPYTILRNGWYTENYAPAFAQAAASGAVLTSAGDGRISAATRQNFAEAAAAVLTGNGHDGAIYELGGDTAFTMRELADTFAAALGRPIELQNLTSDQHRDALLEAGLDEPTAGFLVLLDRNTADGELVTDTTDLSRLIGRPTTPVAEIVTTWHA